MRINLENYYKNYKEIMIKLYDNNDILPNLLVTIPIPEEYDFTEEELFYFKENNLILDKLVEQRRDEINFFKENKNKKELPELINDYKKSEFNGWIKKYPEYKKIMNEL